MAKKFLDSNGVLFFWQKLKAFFVEKEDGKGLSSNDFTDAEKSKLSGLSNYTLPTASTSTLGGVKVGSGLTISSNGTLSATGGGEADSVNWENITDKPTWVDSSTKPTYTIDEVDTKKVTVRTSQLGVANGVATLDSSGLVPSTQLPSYVDDIIEGYYNSTDGKFYTTNAYTTAITGETGKIYVDVSTNLSYRYGGSSYVVITSSDMVAITNAEIEEIINS